MSIVQRFFSSRTNWVGLLIVWTFIEAAFFTPWLAPKVLSTDPANPGLTEIRIVRNKQAKNLPQPPSWNVLLGTTDRQEDVFYLLVWGVKSMLAFSLKTALATAAIGIVVGAVSGNVGGWLGGLLMRITDGFLTIPLVAGLVILSQLRNAAVARIPNIDTIMAAWYTGPVPPLLKQIFEFEPVMWAIILFSWMPYARILHAMITRTKMAEFVQAARALGSGPVRLVLRHLIPNTISPVIVLLARDMGWMVILQATLTFAGFGGASRWGSLLLTQRRWIIGVGGNPLGYWWVWLPVTLALVAYGVGWSLVGDGLNDALNPHSASTGPTVRSSGR